MSNVTFPASLSGHEGAMRSGFGGAYTLLEFCQRYSIGRSTAYAEHNAGRLSFRKVGNRTLILHGEAERWAASLPESAK